MLQKTKIIRHTTQGYIEANTTKATLYILSMLLLVGFSFHIVLHNFYCYMNK